MHLGLFRREHLQSDDPRLIGSATTDQFQKTHGALQAWSEVEHKDDGSHGAIHADSLDVTGDVTVGGSVNASGDQSLFGGDVVAQYGTGHETAIGVLNAINGVSLVPGEVVRDGVLIGGITNGFWLEQRAAPAPMDPGSYELAIWNLKHSTVTPSLRIGRIGGVPTVIDGGTGATLNLGDFTRPLAQVYANLVSGTSLVARSGGYSATFVADSARSAASLNSHFVPTTSAASDLGWTNGASYQRWRSLYLSAGLYEYNRTVAQGIPQSVPYSAGLFTTYGGAAWTVEAGDLIGYTYTLVGKICIIQINLQNSSVAAGAGVFLIIQNPPGISWASVVPTMPMATANDAGVVVRAYFNIIDGNRMGCVKVDASNWNVATNNTTIIGTMIGMVN
jgi:hypothetical protein